MKDKWGKVIERRNANQRAYTARNRDAINARLAIKRLDPEYRAKIRAAGRAYAQKNKVRAKNYQLMRKYGITLEDFKRMSDGQGGMCAVCLRTPTGKGKSGSLCVDHCHQTGQIRGLLCDSCNRAIGLMGDKAETLLMASHYLSMTRERRESA